MRPIGVSVLPLVSFATALILLACGCTGGEQRMQPPVPAPDPGNSPQVQMERLAWNQLSSALLSTQTASAQWKTSVTSAQDIGMPRTSASISASVPWSEYEEVAKNLRQWQKLYRRVGKPYWHQLAKSGITLSDAMVRYASTADKAWLSVADKENQRINSLIKQHCGSDPAPYAFDGDKVCS
jgi:hypothetical protein